MKPEDFISQYESALATQNWDTISPLFHENVCVIFSNGDVHKGIYKVKSAFESNFSTIKNEQYVISNVRWLAQSDTTAVYSFDYAWKGVIMHKSVQGNGVGTSVLIRNSERWILLLEELKKVDSNLVKVDLIG